MLQTTKSPAPVRMALERGGLLMVGVVFAVGTAWLASASRQRLEPPFSGWAGSDDMSTDTIRLSAGEHAVTWRAPCDLDVDLWRKNAGSDVLMTQVGFGPRGTRTLPVRAGDYFLSVGATCDWTASIR